MGTTVDLRVAYEKSLLANLAYSDDIRSGMTSGQVIAAVTAAGPRLLHCSTDASQTIHGLIHCFATFTGYDARVGESTRSGRTAMRQKVSTSFVGEAPLEEILNDPVMDAVLARGRMPRAELRSFLAEMSRRREDEPYTGSSSLSQ